MRKTIGKYRILRRIGSGGFADVYKAVDTVEGVPVALKIPGPLLQTEGALEDFKREIRLTARLEHENILPLKNAEFYNGRLVVAHPLGTESLGERLRRRMSLETCLSFAQQILAALAHAHAHNIIHCDVKPENFILFPDGELRLGDFGIAKVVFGTRSASGSGTVGYVAPEQALGKASLRSDVFSAGLLLYRMFTGALPEWPYKRPLPGAARLRRRFPREVAAFFDRAIRVDHRKRFRDAGVMEAAFLRLLPAIRRHRAPRPARRPRPRPAADWRRLRWREFQQRYGQPLRPHAPCARCGGPVSEAMRACPWCGTSRKRHRDKTGFPARCSRCGRGRKLDWRFCAWCFGPGFREVSDRRYADKRYDGRCHNAGCKRKTLMPFMRYCPWCRRKVRRRWPLPGSRDRCRSCGWGVVSSLWDFCPWCTKRMR